jgi:hypothetical protein
MRHSWPRVMLAAGAASPVVVSVCQALIPGVGALYALCHCRLLLVLLTIPYHWRQQLLLNKAGKRDACCCCCCAKGAHLGNPRGLGCCFAASAAAAAAKLGRLLLVLGSGVLLGG